MRSDNCQTDIFRNRPPSSVQWRDAAEKCAEQFPGDQRRLNYYLEGMALAEKLEQHV